MPPPTRFVKPSLWMTLSLYAPSLSLGWLLVLAVLDFDRLCVYSSDARPTFGALVSPAGSSDLSTLALSSLSKL